MRYAAGLILCAVLCLALAGCGGGDSAPGTVASAGTVRQFFVEGGGYVLKDDAGKSYLPDNLGPQFQQNGLRVFFQGHLTGLSTAQQVGATIHLDEIHALP